MKHSRQQLPVHSADNKACRQFSVSSPARLTPSPDLSPPEPRLGQDTDTYGNTAPAYNLLGLYRSTDIANGGDSAELVEGRAPDDGPEGSEDGSRGVPVSFEESTSHVVAIAASFSEKDCSSDDEGLIAACSFAEGEETAETSSAVVVAGNAHVPGALSSPEHTLYLRSGEPLTGETTQNISVAARQHTKDPAIHEEEGHQRNGAIETEFDSRLGYAFTDRTLCSVEAENVAGSAQADCTARSRNASFSCKEADDARTVAAGRRRSVLGGCITVVAFGLLTLACISPWNVEAASSCIIGGLCISVLGWVAVSLKSQLLIVLHIVLLFFFLVMLIVTTALNFHWAVQSFRALRHAYFDDTFSQGEISSARARETSSVPSSIFSTPYIVHLNPSQDALVSGVAAKGLAYDSNSLVQHPISSTGASSILTLLTIAQEAGGKISEPISTPFDQPPSRHPPPESHAQNAAEAVLQPLRLRRPSRLSASPVHRSIVDSAGTSRNLHGSISFIHSSDIRQSQTVDGVDDSQSKTDELNIGSPTRRSVGSDTNKLNTSRSVALLDPVAGSVWQTARRLETLRQLCASDELPCVLHDVRTPPNFRVLLGTAGWSYLRPTNSLGEMIDDMDVRMPLIMKDKTDDVTIQTPRQGLQGTSSMMLLQKTERDRNGYARGPRQSLHLKQNRISMLPLDSPEDEYSRRVPTALASGASATDSHNSQSRLIRNALPVNVSGTLPTTLTNLSFSSSGSPGPGETTGWGLEEGTVIPEPARCDNMPRGLLKYVHSTRRQLETYGMLCAFSRYDMWGLFDSWSIDCENGCGFKFLATKRYMWSRGLEASAEAASALAGRAEDLSHSTMPSRDQRQNTRSGIPRQGRTVEDHRVPPDSSVAPRHLNVVKSTPVSYSTLEYLQWHAALPLDKQKACLEGALNVACSVVRSHYLMLLPPLAVLLLLTSLVLLGIGIAALRSSLRLKCVAARKS